ncbi:hypothetical protein EYR41_009048 [Orbilia oligospora]|uniref:Uncharacterized protein n=1 Tax=Orbilia oligospora TaxID=2813651 RepID=A0A7C8KI42_ORBOL|nr:hypothetical protein TWF751_007412 [Orbilia oligospora]TGJ65043.1 hypothetical protein EYR41_009048 [Orbilia oligospora]
MNSETYKTNMEHGKGPAPVHASPSEPDRDGGQRMVGITIPAISNKVLWYDGVRTVKDLCGAVLRQNPILDRKRLTILINGKRAGFYDVIPERAVVTAYYRFVVKRHPPNRAQGAADGTDDKANSGKAIAQEQPSSHREQPSSPPAAKEAAEEVHLGDLLSFDEVPEVDLLSFDEVPKMDLLSFDEISDRTTEPKVPRCHILDLYDDGMGLLNHWEALLLPFKSRPPTPKSLLDL